MQRVKTVDLSRLKEIYWTQPWWHFDPESAGVWDHLYRTFNLVEGTIWVVFSLLVVRRYLQSRKSSLEIAYAVTFLVFGLTDFREAFVQSGPLVLLKGIVLVGLFTLRKRIVSEHYPEAWF